jgi:hypothetical protein
MPYYRASETVILRLCRKFNHTKAQSLRHESWGRHPARILEGIPQPQLRRSAAEEFFLDNSSVSVYLAQRSFRHPDKVHP